MPNLPYAKIFWSGLRVNHGDVIDVTESRIYNIFFLVQLEQTTFQCESVPHKMSPYSLRKRYEDRVESIGFYCMYSDE